MNVEIVKVSSEWQEKGKNKWQKLNVVFKNPNKNGEIDGRNLLSFNHAAAFNALKDAKKGEIWALEETTNAKGYQEITNAQLVTKAEVTNTVSELPKTSSPVRSNFESPEERALRQKLIVRQSSLSNAIEFLGPKSKIDDVFKAAEAFNDWVWQKPDPIQAIKDMVDDIPEVN